MRTFMRPAAAGILTLAIFAACKRDRDAAGSLDSARAMPVDTFTAAAPAAPAAPAAAIVKWATPNAIGFAVVANLDEVALGKLAQRKAKNAAVRAYAKLMVMQHAAMLADAKNLGKKMSVTPDTAMGDAHDLMNHDRDDMKAMTDMPAGDDWDKAYMDKMIAGHKEVLAKLQDAAANTPDAQVKTALDAASTKVQAHLTKAEEVRAQLK